jgi:predicted DNA-binding transcriptional regulator AlpA
MTEKSAKAHPPTELLTSQTVAPKFHTTPTTLARWVAAGTFPKPLRFGRQYLWLATDIEALLGVNRNA